MPTYTIENLKYALEHYEDANEEYVLRALFSEEEIIISMAAKICGLKKIKASIPRLKMFVTSANPELNRIASLALMQINEKDCATRKEQPLGEISLAKVENTRFNSCLLNSLLSFVQDMTASIDPAHGVWHAKRVWETALWLSDGEEVDLIVVQLASLLHDTCDWKYPDAEKKQKIVSEYLTTLNLKDAQTEQIMDIIANMSYKKNNGVLYTKSLEGQIVQDADRLEAIGATGVIRAMMYSGSKGNPITTYQIVTQSTPYTLPPASSYAMHHFYEKLLLLKDGMNTVKARQEAFRRHAFMLQFMDEFYDEIERTSS
jgi:uncharacterized protein